MGTLDALNTRYGRGSIQLAIASVRRADRTWTMKQELKTPNYTNVLEGSAASAGLSKLSVWLRL